MATLKFSFSPSKPYPESKLMLSEMTEFAVLCLTSLFAMVSPLSVAPVFLSMTHGLELQACRQVAYKACFTAGCILILFALGGQFILNLFAISIDSLKIAGGAIFFVMGYEMIQARLSRTKFDKNSDEEQAYNKDIAITPLAIPLMAGPGAIATVIILMGSHSEISYYATLFASIIFICGITCIFLLFATPIMGYLGESGNKVLVRIMGLIVMVIAVEFIVSGLTPILRRIFMIEG